MLCIGKGPRGPGRSHAATMLALPDHTGKCFLAAFVPAAAEGRRPHAFPRPQRGGEAGKGLGRSCRQSRQQTQRHAQKGPWPTRPQRGRFWLSRAKRPARTVGYGPNDNGQQATTEKHRRKIAGCTFDKEPAAPLEGWARSSFDAVGSAGRAARTTGERTTTEAPSSNGVQALSIFAGSAGAIPHHPKY